MKNHFSSYLFNRTILHPSPQDIEEIYTHLGKTETIYVTVSSVYTKTYELAALLRERFKDRGL